jgi:hypothetical protein
METNTIGNQQVSRTGNFTSSAISALCSNGRAKGTFGKPFYTYAEEKAFEEILGRSLTKEAKADSLEWGNLCERFAYEQIEGLEYNLVSKKRYSHLELPWSGMPDMISDDHIADIKCPWTIKSFLSLVTTDDLKASSPEYYWQLVSNAILCNKDKAKLFVFMPRIDQIEAIQELAIEKNSVIKYKTVEQLPYIPKDSKIKSLYCLDIEIPLCDKKLLTDRVREAEIEKNKIVETLKTKLC